MMNRIRQICVFRNSIEHSVLSSTICKYSSHADQQWTISQYFGSKKDTYIIPQSAGQPTYQQHSIESTPHKNSIPTSMSPPPLPSPSSLPRLVQSNLIATFLPSGYPSTVAPGYFKYVSWQALHHASGSANGVLASTFLLYSVGLGAGAIPTAGALSWVVKDGIGQLGTLIFGRCMAHNFDVSSRMWYLAASLKLNIAMGLEIMACVFPQHFLPIGALANAIKGLAWMAGGSSRSAFNVAFASNNNNIADITAKATSQTICTSLIGTSIGVTIASLIGQSTEYAYVWYSALGAVHMWSGYQSARSVPLSTLNPSRLILLAQDVLELLNEENRGGGKDHDVLGEKKQGHYSNNTNNNIVPGVLPSPAEMASKDIIIPFTLFASSSVENKRTKYEFARDILKSLRIGASLRKLLSHASFDNDDVYNRTMIALYLEQKRRHIVLCNANLNEISLILHENATCDDILTAFLQIVALHFSHHASSLGMNDRIGINERNMIIESLKFADKALPRMKIMLKEAGWDCANIVVESKRQRAVW